MTPERYHRLLAHFDLACDLDTEGRTRLLRRLRGEDVELAAILTALLRTDLPSSLSEPALSDTDTLVGPHAVAAAPLDSPRPDPPKGIDGALVAGRYRIEQLLGSGGAGTVYRACDLASGVDVAIKFLLVGAAVDQGQVLRFRREFRAISRLNHPGCVKVFSEGAHGDHRYIVMEYVAGGDLQRLVGGDPSLLLAVLIQLCTALEYVHGQRIVHRDLKPANVLLAPGDPITPRLADFGIAKVHTESVIQHSRTGVIVGTVDYMSPEQSRGRPVDPRSDLYSLGCLIYRLFARRPPFLGSTYERLMARIESEPPPLRELVPTVSQGLSDLAGMLLKPDPARRPQSAFVVGQALAALLVEGAGGGSLPARLLVPAPRGAFLYRAGVLGREDLLTRGLSLCRAALGGAPGAPTLIALCGEAGMGKSTVAAALSRQLEAGGARVLAVSPPEIGAGPLSPFPELLALLDREGIAPGPAAPAGRPLQDGAAARRRQAALLAERLLAAQRACPVVLLLENLHNASQGALALLAELLPLLSPGPRPALLATLRPTGREALARAVGAQAPLVFIEVGPLDGRAVAAVCCAMLGIGEPGLPPLLCEILLRDSGGNPWLIQSGLRALVDRGALRRSADGWKLIMDGPATAAMDRALSGRLTSLRPTTLHVLQVAAAVGATFDTDLVRRAAAVDEDTALDALDEALRAGVIRIGHEGGEQDRYDFDHARLCEVLYAGMATDARQGAHRAIFSILRERGCAAATLAYHAERAGDPVPAHHALRAAAAEASAAYDMSAAERHLHAALALVAHLPSAEQIAAREECTEGLADALQVLGQAPQAAALLAGLLREQTRALVRTKGGALLDTDPGERGVIRARRLRKLGQARQRAGDTAGALTALEQSLQGLGVVRPVRRFDLMLQIGRDIAAVLVRHVLHLRPRPHPALWERAVVHRELALLYRWIDDERSAAHYFGAARAAALLGAPEILIEAYAAVATFMAFTASTSLGNWVEGQARRLALSSDNRMGLARILLWRGGADIFLREDPAEGLLRMDEGIRLLHDLGDRVLYAWSLAWRGWAEVMAGRFDKARVDFQHAIDTATEMNIEWLRADATCGYIMTDLAFGRFDECEAAARAVLQSQVRLALPAIEVIATEVLGGHAFLTGDFREAAERFGRARDLYVAHHLDRGWGFLIHIEHAEALLCLTAQEGDAAVPDLAAQVWHDLRLAERRLGQLPFYRGCALVLRGVYHARRSRTALARRHFARALRLRKAPRQTYMDLWVLWRTAFELRRLGDDPATVRPLLDEAQGIIASLGLSGMLSWLALVRRLYDV